MRLQGIISVFILSSLLYGNNPCYGGPAEAYFPLKAGMTWEYNVISDKSATRKVRITNLASREINDKTLTPQRWDIMGISRYYLIAEDDSGIYRYAEQKSENGPPTLTKPKLYHLKNPIGIGTTWDITTQLGDDNVNINLTIESINDVVKVPAGTFDNCVKIKQIGEGPSGEKGGTALSITAYEWYAPGVGLVKSMVAIKKKLKNETKYSENLTYQLESFKK
jgi:hypothetical protein